MVADQEVFSEILEDNCLGLAAQLAFYFLLALFPALIFLVALIGLLPIEGVMSTWLAALARFAPPDVLDTVRDQFLEVRRGNQVSLLTVGFAGAVWSSSTAMTAIIGTLNTAYGLRERRPWWKCRFLAIGLTLSLAVFMVLAQALILLAPWAADLAAARTGVGAEVNAEIDRAAEYRRELTPAAVDGQPKIGIAAERTHAWRDGWLRRFHGQPRV